MSEIQQFYAGQSVFITGSTGFVGKVLLEKLLHSCPDIKTIFILIRAKKGKSPEERISELVADSVFNELRSDYPDFANKIVSLIGDIGEEKLGLSTVDYARLVNEVTIIFHLAATVRFDEKIGKAVTVNVNSTKAIIDIAKASKNLKVGIYVSTAYSHCVRKTINEQLYPAPLTCEEVNKLVEDAGGDKMTEEQVKSFTENVIGEWPNTYSFTKAVSEGVVAEFAEDMPFAIFRPSIVVNSYMEPVPGWLSHPIGLPGMVCALGLGILHVVLIDDQIRVDLVPVDYACNSLIAVAWKTAITERRRNEDVPVYNYVCSNRNPVVWYQLFNRMRIFGPIYPSISAVYHPSGTFTKSNLLFSILHFFLHVIPALLVDSVAKLLGKDLGLYKLASKLGNAWCQLKYFTTQQWDFEDQRIQDLWKQMTPLDRRIFPFNIEKLDWDEHTMSMVRGLRKYIMRESDENLEQSRRRAFYLKIVHRILCVALLSVALWMIWKLFNGWSPIISAKFLAS